MISVKNKFTAYLMYMLAKIKVTVQDYKFILFLKQLGAFIFIFREDLYAEQPTGVFAGSTIQSWDAHW